MTSALGAHIPAAVLGWIVAPAARALLLAATAGVAMRALRVCDAAARHGVWKMVLGAALAMPLLAALVPSLGISMRAPAGWAKVGTNWAPAAEGRSSGAPALPRPATNAARAGERGAATPAVAAPTAAATATVARSPDAGARWELGLVAFYLAVALLLLLRLLLGMLTGRRLRRSALAVEDGRALAAARAAAEALGLRAPPRVAESEFVCVPLTLGVLKPMIVLPGDWRGWEAAKLGAVLAHEAAHIRRGDGLVRCLSLVHRAAFWFSPLPWWLDRKLAELAEEACDETALRAGADRGGYATALADFFASAAAAPGRVRWEGIAMAAKTGAGRRAERRLERILAWEGDPMMQSKRKTITLAAAALIAPLALLAAAARPRIASGSSPRPASDHATLAPVAVPAMAEPAQAANSGTLPEPAQAAASAQGSASGRERAPQAGLAPYERLVVVTPPNCATFSSEGTSLGDCGAASLPAAVASLRATLRGDFLWFERKGQGYTITDPATVQSASALIQGLRNLAQQQSLLGATQSNLGKAQSRLGEEQSRLAAGEAVIAVPGSRIPDFSAQLRQIAAQLHSLEAGGAQQEQLAQIQAELADIQAQLGALQGQAADAQSNLGARQTALAAKQSRLAAEQAGMGLRQAALAQKQAAATRHAQRALQSLVAHAVQAGLAKPE